MSQHHCLLILPVSELRHVFLGCDHFAVCMTTSCCDFDFLVVIVSAAFLSSYVSILCRDLMVMSRPLLFPISFLLVATSFYVAIDLLLLTYFPGRDLKVVSRHHF